MHYNIYKVKTQAYNSGNLSDIETNKDKKENNNSFNKKQLTKNSNISNKGCIPKNLSNISKNKSLSNFIMSPRNNKNIHRYTYKKNYTVDNYKSTNKCNINKYYNNINKCNSLIDFNTNYLNSYKNNIFNDDTPQNFNKNAMSLMYEENYYPNKERDTYNNNYIMIKAKPKNKHSKSKSKTNNNFYKDQINHPKRCKSSINKNINHKQYLSIYKNNKNDDLNYNENEFSNLKFNEAHNLQNEYDVNAFSHKNSFNNILKDNYKSKTSRNYIRIKKHPGSLSDINEINVNNINIGINNNFITEDKNIYTAYNGFYTKRDYEKNNAKKLELSDINDDSIIKINENQQKHINLIEYMNKIGKEKSNSKEMCYKKTINNNLNNQKNYNSCNNFNKSSSIKFSNKNSISLSKRSFYKNNFFANSQASGFPNMNYFNQSSFSDITKLISNKNYDNSSKFAKRIDNKNYFHDKLQNINIKVNNLINIYLYLLENKNIISKFK